MTAARALFSEEGYDGTTMRGVARAAGVDPRLVHHYFDDKETLFLAVLDVPFRPRDIVEAMVGEGVEGLGERIITFFLSLWDPPAGRERLRAIVASTTSSPAATRVIREFLTREVFRKITVSLGVDEPDLRASLLASQMLGLAMARYVVEIEPLTSADPAVVRRCVAPTVQRYLTGEL